LTHRPSGGLDRRDFRGESPAARSAARYVEVGGSGGYGWMGTAAPGRGGRPRRRAV